MLSCKEIIKNMIREEIKKLFSNSDPDSAYRIEQVGKEYPAYVVRFIGSIGVAVFYDGDDFKESFANSEIFTGVINVDGMGHKCLFLVSSVESTRNEFAVFCEDFVDPGDDGNKRKELLSDPSIWWNHWKLLIGNAISEKRPYAIIGELLMYEYLLKKDVAVNWGGPKASSHDLITKDADYEVKSTTSSYDKLIHIAGQFQQQTDKRLILYFCRFEKNINGISINDIVDRLVNSSGIFRDEINGKLSLQGYGPGTSARNEKYVIHEVIQYEVDETFPNITPAKFKDGIIPKGIKKIEYDVDLSVLDGKNVSI